MRLTRDRVRSLPQIAPFLPFDNPTFGNPQFEAASYRVLILRLSPFQDVDRSIPHLFLFQEVRRALPETFIDLAFFPTAPQREQLEREGDPPLIGTQSLCSAGEFDLVLVSNAYTLELINLPHLLLRSGIPLFASQRGPEWPIFILGGSNALATQAIIRQDGDSLVDGIFFGEGEGWVSDLVRLLHRNREKDRAVLLEQAAQEITGLWRAGSLDPVTKAICTPEPRFLPVAYPILNSPEARTANLAINYGCLAFCSFCFEGYDRKPYRELDLLDVLSTAHQIKREQGVEELNLYSFNVNTHRDILPMILELHQSFDRVGLKSQRLDILQHTDYLLEAEIEADKRNFTLGIEGISQRMRDWLHKSLPREDVQDLLKRMFGRQVRQVKLFYILTGHETDEDIAEFRQFLHWLKGIRRAHGRNIRVVFSFGLLIRMPFTPLRYDRLLLNEQAWRASVGQVKSACETNGFEFRLAFDWPAYCVTQVLVMGGYWLADPIVALARKGYCFDTTLVREYWDELKCWMEQTGHWNDAFLGEKSPDYPFTLAFVESGISDEFLYRQYQEAQAGTDSGYCLGSTEQPGHCLGCGVCRDEKQRRTITHHHVHQPEQGAYMAQLRAVMARKRRLEPVYVLLRLNPLLAGASTEFIDALAFREILTRYPELVDNLLAVRESLFSVRPNDRQFPPVMGGETVFGLKAWDAAEAERILTQLPDEPENRASGIHIVGLAEGFTPGVFTRLHLDLRLPARFFPEPRVCLEQYLRGAYLRYSLRREDAQHGDQRYRFDIPKKALKKKILFEGSFENQGDFCASLDIGPKFDVLAFLQTFDQDLHHHAQVQVSDIRW